MLIRNKRSPRNSMTSNLRQVTSKFVPDSNSNFNNIVQVNPGPVINAIRQCCTKQCSLDIWFVACLINGSYLYPEKRIIIEIDKIEFIA